MIKADTNDKNYLKLDKAQYNFVCETDSTAQSTMIYSWSLATMTMDGTLQMVNLTTLAT